MAPERTADPLAASADIEHLADRLFSAALLRGSFTLRSGVRSDRYFDKYRVSCEPTLLRPVAAALVARMRELAPEASRILAPELGAVPIATAMGLVSGLPTSFVRGTGKAHGTAQRIEGSVTPGQQAVLVEDVVTSGGAALEALEAARAAGADVRHTLCILDRDGGGREALAGVGAPLTSLLTVEDLDAAFAAGLGIQA